MINLRNIRLFEGATKNYHSIIKMWITSRPKFINESLNEGKKKFYIDCDNQDKMVTLIIMPIQI